MSDECFLARNWMADKGAVCESASVWLVNFSNDSDRLSNGERSDLEAQPEVIV